MVAPQRQTAKDAQKYDFNFRTGLNGLLWGGMFPDGDPESPPPNRPRLVINSTLRNGLWTARGGQRAINATALHASDACIPGLFDFPVGTPRQLVVLGDGCPDVSSSVGFSANLYDHEQLPLFQPGVYYNGATVGVAAAVFGDNLYLGEDLSLRRMNAIRAPWGSKQLAISGPGQDTLIRTFTTGTSISALLAFDGKLFGCIDNGGSSEVFYFDGVTIHDDSATLTDKVQRFALFRDTLILGFDGTPNEIQVRTIGAKPGSYSTVAPGAGTCNFWRAASYKDVLYITTNGEDLFSFDGTTLTRIPVATSGIPANSKTYGIASAYGNLYVAYEDVTGTAAKLAKYDGSTWTAVEKNFTAQDATMRAALDLVLYRGNLHVAMRDSATIYSLFQSPGSSVTGTWTETSQSGSVSGPINELLVF